MFLLNEKKISLLDSVSSMETFLSICQKIFFKFSFKEINKNGNFFYCKFAWNSLGRWKHW